MGLKIIDGTATELSKWIREKGIEEELIEDLADLEHQQWSHMMKFFLGLDVKTISKNVVKWNNQANTDYKDLSEQDKEQDKVWARKVLEKIKKVF